MSDRNPDSDWEQPRGDFSRGGAPHYSGNPHRDVDTSDAEGSADGRAQARKWMIFGIVYGIVGVAAVVAYVVFFD